MRGREQDYTQAGAREMSYRATILSRSPDGPGLFIDSDSTYEYTILGPTMEHGGAPDNHRLIFSSDSGDHGVVATNSNVNIDPFTLLSHATRFDRRRFGADLKLFRGGQPPASLPATSLSERSLPVSLDFFGERDGATKSSKGTPHAADRTLRAIVCNQRGLCMRLAPRTLRHRCACVCSENPAAATKTSSKKRRRDTESAAPGKKASRAGTKSSPSR